VPEPPPATRRPRLDRASAQIRNAVRAMLPHEPASFIVAVSGGADSMALAAACAHLAATTDHAFSAVTVDHGLQPDSAAVATAAHGRLNALGLPAQVVTADISSAAEGPEGAARTARYRALESARVTSGAMAVLTAHTLDDQAETVLLGLARGSGARSLAGMRPRTGTLWRPLLGIERTATRASCAALGIEIWDDPWNTDPAYARVRVRKRVLPVLETELGPGVARALARTAALLAADSDELEEQAAVAAQGLTAGGRLDVAAAQLPAALRTRIIRDWLRSHTGGGQEIGAAHTAEVDDLLCGRRTGAVSVPVAARIVRTSAGLEVRDASAR